MPRPILPLTPEENLLSKNFLAYVEARRAAAGGGTPTKGDPSIGGACTFTLDGNIYRKQSCNCEEGFHEAEPPIVDGSAPPTIIIACEPDEDDPVVPDNPTPGGLALAATPTATLDAVKRRKLRWFLAERTGTDPDDNLPVFGGYLIPSNGYAIYEKRGMVYELKENHAKISCYPPKLPLVDDSAPPVIKVGCRRVRRLLPESSCPGNHKGEGGGQAEQPAV